MENLPSDRRKVIEELERGREFAAQLHRLVLNPSGEGTSPSAQDLVDKVVTSMSNTLLLLNPPSHDSQMHKMGRSRCLKEESWTPEEDEKLVRYIQKHGHGSWLAIPKLVGLNRSGKSCRLRWLNYLRPDIERDKFSQQEEELILHLHSILGNKWPLIASRLPGRTANEIKNFWNTHLKKKLIPPIGRTHEDEMRERLLLHLSRIRDFIRLLLSYPMRTVHDGELKAWIREASNRSHSLDDLSRLLCQKPLNCFQCLLPMYILENAERGWGPKYADSDGIPEDILSLSVNLAVDQLIQNLLFEDDHVPNIHHVLLSTRDTTEKRLVKEKIESALKDQKIMVHLQETFTQVLLIDASNSQGLPAEVHVQHQIAQQLHLPMIEGHGYLLITSIEKEMSQKKYLVLLVDGEAKEPLDPRKVGIPEELAGVVVCITSKQANSELEMAMDLNISTKDHLLPWEVFCANIGLAILQSEYTKSISSSIVKECGGHLLAGVIVAKSLTNAKREAWEHALYKLRSVHSSYDNDMFQGQSSVLLKAFINFIWHDLSKTQKYCLTSCLFIPKLGKLENELINDWISSRLVVASEAEHTLRELVERFALLQVEDTKSRYIQIPQEICAVLQLLNTQNPLFMKKSELGLVEAPNSELWHSAIYIDLADNKLPELPSSPDCHELKVLKLHNNDELTKIPPLFFFKMPLLCILDLSYTSVRELPNSFFELKQLRELFMKSCECFMKLSSEVGKLKNLEKIDLDKTQITHLPKEIQELTNLQSLTLYLFEYRSKKSKEYTSSTIIPFGVISKLKGLKHLSIDVNPDDERWEKNLQVILPEVLVLECLQTISLYIPAPELLSLIPLRIFELDFRFTVGKHMSRIISGALPTAEEKFKQSERSLKFVKGVDVPNEVSFVVRYSKALFLDRHMTIKDLSKFGMRITEQLEVCILAECKEMQTIVDGRCSSRGDILPRLLVLSVSYMKNLRSICEGEVHSCHSFGLLKTLALHNCPVLTTIFTLDFLGNLSLLKVLVVKDCPKVRALISCGPSTLRAGTFLPKLRTMTLVHLPELVSISNGLHIGPSLENLGIYDCPKLERLSKIELSSQNLKVIKGDIKWWKALTWSEAERGIVGRSSIFDSIFSPIDKQADIMSQLALDDDIDDSPGGIFGEPLQSSSVTNSSMNNQVDLRTQSRVDDDIKYHPGGIVGESLQSSSITNSSMNNQVDLRTQSRVDEDVKYHPVGLVGEPLQSSSVTNSSMNNQVDLKTQSRVDEDVKYHPVGIVGEPLQSSSVTNSSLSNQVDLRIQSRVDEDVKYHPGGIVGEPLQSSSSVINSSMNNQVDLRTQSGGDDDVKYHPAPLKSSAHPSHRMMIKDLIADASIRRSDRDASTQASCVTNPATVYSINKKPSGLRIIKDQKQIANRSNRRSDTCSEASPVTNPAILYNIKQTVKSDLESFSSMGGRIEPAANETYDHGVDTN